MRSGWQRAVRIGGRGVRDFCFLMGALRWDSGDARFCRLQIGRAEHGDNPARSVFVQPKHAQDKSCGLTAVIQSRMEREQCAEDDMRFHVEQYPETHCLSSPARGQTFRSGHPNARPVPNARLNLCRRPQNLFCACFSCTNTDRARLPPCSGSSGLNQKERAGIAPCSGFKTARFPNPAKRSHIKTRKSRTARPRRGQFTTVPTLLATNHFQLTTKPPVSCRVCG